VGRAAAVLATPRGRAAAIAALLAAVAAYTAFGGSLPALRTNLDVAVIGFVVIPAVFAFTWLVLPWRDGRAVLAVGAGLAALALLLRALGLETLFDVAKLGALTLIGFWFLSVFEELWWTVVVALIIPWVDALSVWRGPTEYVVSEKPGLFEELAFGFRVPGEDAFAHLGPPDVLFFALFLAAAARFGLRTRWTWLAMTFGLGLTLVLTVWGDVAGLPALPAISLGFLAPNADLIWQSFRGRARVGSVQREAIATYLDAASRRDADAAAALVTDDVELRMGPHSARGVVALRELAASGPEHVETALSLVDVRTDGDDSVATVRQVDTWRETGEVAADRTMEARFRFRDGRISRVQLG
jgi:ketosteroid isomerase-like protein